MLSDPPREASVAAGPESERRARFQLILALAIIGFAKMMILATAGPLLHPDSQSYIAYADAILDHGRAFAAVDWGAEAAPPMIFRPLGYPLVLAAAKLISPGRFEVVVVIVQAAANGVAIWLMFAVASRLLRSSAAAMLAVVLYAGSTSLLWDNSILSDSLFASLWNIVVFALLGQLLECWRLQLDHCFGLGLLWGLALWLRDTGIYFTVLPIILFVAIAAGEWRRSNMALRQLLAFLLASATMTGGAIALNYHRTGEAFFSITGLENWLRPAFDMARAGYAQPFDGDDIVSTAVRETMTDYGFGSQLKLIDHLHQRCACTPTRMQSLVFAKYRSTIQRYPSAYARVVVGNFNYLPLGELVADPVATFNQFIELGTLTPQWRIPGLSTRNLVALKGHSSATPLLLMGLSALAEVASAIVFSVYLLGTPYFLARSLCRERAITGEWIAVAFLWCSFVGVSLAFSLVHYEARHALPLLPAAAVGTVFIGQRLFLARAKSQARAKPQARD